MSGGSMNYLYRRLEEGATFEADTPERIAFAAHLKLVVKALHDIELVDSADYGPGDENEAIRAYLAGHYLAQRDEPGYTEQQVAAACMAAEIPDSKCESLLLALRA